jgi:hypothetical protein
VPSLSGILGKYNCFVSKNANIFISVFLKKIIVFKNEKRLLQNSKLAYRLIKLYSTDFGLGISDFVTI